MTKRTAILLASVLLLFVLLRISGVQMPYHQDEFKNSVAAETSLTAASEFFTHPPLTAIFLRADAVIFGGEHMRVLPLLFGILSALLLFAVVRRRFDDRTALWSTALYAVSFYGIWASLMVDTDGAILPTLFLASVYAYDRLRESPDRKLLWAGLLALALIIGLLVKLSFILVVGALLLDVLFHYRAMLRLRHFWFALSGLGAFIALSILAFFVVHLIDPAFQFGGMIEHARSYMHGGGRNILQILVQGVKALYYLSPLLLVPLVFLSRDLLGKARVFLIYLGLGGLFYFILFDFSRGALDKYLMFAIIPLCVLSGAAVARVLRDESPLHRAFLFGGIVSAALIVCAAFLPQSVVPLYPKSAWFLSVLHGNFTVLTPLTGGSGPLGFYVSFLVIFSGFLIAFLAALAGLLKREWRKGALVVILCAGLAYNALFLEEFAFGKINGSAAQALHSSLAFINQSDEVKEIVTFNDTGAYELIHMHKYAGRFYATPAFEAAHKVKFEQYAGHYLVMEMPLLYDGFYSQYFAKCAIVFRTQSGAIPATIYLCGQTKN